MSDERPDPDQLLKRLRHEEQQQARGKLKIFLGMCAGVGKTYTMLEAARVRSIEGRDVVIGVVETHRRTDTEMLVLGLDLLPRREVPYQGVVLREFDLDTCLARKPELVLLDELAHSNAPGSRHEKRWQDVQELLAAGISVYTTLNIQHIESLNDVVAQVTGVVVRETVPDSLVDAADEIELVDLPPEELLQRLAEGKVYGDDRKGIAAQNFFRRGNLIALRELALRYVAEHVDEQVQRYRRDRSIARTWPVRERLLVCVTASPQSARLVRATRRVASALQAEWLAVHVETPRAIAASAKERERLHRILRLAEQMGAETKVLIGASTVEELLRFARARNVTKIVVGKSAQSAWHRLVRGSVIEQLARRSGDIDLYVISGEGQQAQDADLVRGRGWRHAPWRELGVAVAAVAGCTLLSGLFMPRLAPANIVMLYLASVALVSLKLGRGAGILASLLSVAAFDFFFVPPSLTFAVSDVQYVVTFAVMLAVALLISNLTVTIRQQAEQARRRALQNGALFELSQKLADAGDIAPLVKAAALHTEQTFGARADIWLRSAGGAVELQSDRAPAPDERERAVAQWVLEHRQVAGRGTSTLPAARALYLPLAAAQGCAGVLAIEPYPAKRFVDADEQRLLETFASQIGLAIERVQLLEAASMARMQVETERLRSALLSSVSHDFRTPLQAILGAASGLEDAARLGESTRRELLATILQESRRLDRMVRNLLDLTRLESGRVELHKEWLPIEEIVGAALHQLRDQLADRQVTTQLSADLPLVLIDGVLIEQLLVNLVDNAVKHTPAQAPIEIGAALGDGEVVLEVRDRGPGIAPEEIERIFVKFYRAPDARGRGAGLGLTICAAIARAHGGRIWVENRAGGGAAFRVTIPITRAAPEIVPEAAS